ncbi:MAG: hypothetical protein HY671_02300 [Chloroflexi bacterium]|nr:hypothetical protein [Chloroflexota bacterium]
MSPDVRTIVIIIHFLGVLLMAAPFYALVVVNERARFGAPPGYNTDRYMEQMITSQAIRCYAYLGVVLVTGLVLAAGQKGFGWGGLLANWVLLLKWVAVAALLGLLSYIHFSLQPKVNALLAQLRPGELLSDDRKPVLMGLRTRRKRMAGTCLFLVFSALLLGVRLVSQLNWIAFVVLIALSGLFAWRVFKTGVRWGWV